MPVEPEVNRIFATVSGPTLRVLALERRARVGLEQLRHRRRARAHRLERRTRISAGSAAYTSPGFTSSKMALSLPKSFDISEYAGDIGAGRNADVHRAEREQGMVDAVVGEDRDRLFGAEPAVEQRLPDAAHVAVGLAVRDPAPRFALALGEEQARRVAVGPLHQPFGDAARIRPELLRRAQNQRAVGALLEIDLRRRKPHGRSLQCAQ